MADKLFRVKWGFSLARLTWTYDAYVPATSAAGALTAARDLNVLNAFASLHSSAVDNFRINVARVRRANDGDPFARETSRFSPDFTGPSHDRIPDITNVTARIQLSGGGRFRVMSIRGLEDVETRRDEIGHDINSGIEYGALITALKDKFHIYFQIPPTTTGYDWFNITNIAPTPLTNLQFSTFTTPVAHGFVRGSRIVFSQATSRELIGYQNQFTVTDAPTTTTFVIGSQYASPEDSITPVNFRVRKSEYASVVIEDGEFLDFSTRNTGNSFGRKKGQGKRHAFRRG